MSEPITAATSPPSQLSSQLSSPLPLPPPRVPITVRPGVLGDVPFLDSLQKLHAKQVGWMPTKQFEEKVAAGHVLIAEEVRGQSSVVSSEESEDSSLSPTTDHGPLTRDSRLGYCIGTDQYFKRDDVGIIYQMNVAPSRQRGFVGATLLKAMFDRAAYGCRLFCCWCAQDIEANRFWESMGFVPLAFRAGSEKRQRTHVFWQKRIRQGDVSTPWWFPSRTTGGSIREDRLVLPIPPGTHWRDAMPILLPGQATTAQATGRALPGSKARRPLAKKVQKPTAMRRQFGPPSAEPIVPEPATTATAAESEKAAKPKRAKRKNDPKLVAAARELRDRWLEQVNASPLAGGGKYNVSRQVAGTTTAKVTAHVVEPKLLAA